MKASALRDKSVSDLRALLKEQLETQFKLKMQHGNGQLTGFHQLKTVRRNIARLKTLFHELNSKKRKQGA